VPAGARQAGRGARPLPTRRHSDEARVVLVALLEERPDLWRAWNAIGFLHDRSGDWSEAETAYRAALEAAPPDAAPSILNNLGVSAMAQGRYDEAAGYLRQALAADAGLEVSRANLRLVLGMQGRYAEAMAGLALGETPAVLNNLGYVAMMQGDLARAEAYFQRALEASPSYYETAAGNLALLSGTRGVGSLPGALPELSVPEAPM